jgi:hypothetical protein
MVSPAAKRSKVPVISIRVYLNVGRPPQTPKHELRSCREDNTDTTHLGQFQ